MTTWRNKDTTELISTIADLRSTEEAKQFLRDLLTEGELIEFGKRWRAANLLYQGTSYVEIVERTGLSSTTVARISKWLQRGSGGYRKILKRHNSATKD